MSGKKIETIILVDDTKSVYADGGKNAIPRKDRYKVLLSALRKELGTVNKACLILGDGIFVLTLKDDKTEIPEKPTEKFTFPDRDNGDTLVDKIVSLSGKSNTLLLIDYMLNNLKRDEKIGMQLCRDVLAKLSKDSIIKMPYTRVDLSREERVLKISDTEEYTLLSAFPISSPTDAAKYVVRKLEEDHV